MSSPDEFYRLDKYADEETLPIPVRQWVEERRDNCARIAATKSEEDRAGWIEDMLYFEEILRLLASPDGGEEEG